MKDYLFIIRGGDDTSHFSPEEMQSHMDEWGVWMGGIAQQGKLVGGEPLHKEARTLTEKGHKVTDRPLAEGKELVGGYIIVKADTLDEAADMAKDCPGFQLNCSIEVREIMPLD